VYPINLAFVDGQVSEELYREEHELDYDRIKESEQEKGDSDTSAPEPNQTGSSAEHER
jgi:hypothetical protein